MLSKNVGLGVAAVLAAGALAMGCGSDGDTIILGSSSSGVPTAADAISTRLEDSWAPNERGIIQHDDLAGGRVFRSRNGDGLLFWAGGDDGAEKLFGAFMPANGGVQRPVRIDVPNPDDGGIDGDATDGMVGTFVSNDAAVFAFIAGEDNDDSSSTDAESERVYYLTWTRSGGFSKPVAVDTNSSPSSTDDNDVNTLFMITNLVDGTQRYDTDVNDLDQFVSGPAGDSATNLTSGVYFGWQNLDTNGDARLEGAFVDLTTLQLDTVSSISIPVASTGESVNGVIVTSGRDMLFEIQDATSTPPEDHLYLVRADFANLDLDAPIDLDRGDSTNASSYSIDTDTLVLIGDGYRPLNGATSTWVIFTDNNYSDATVTNADADLMVFQIDDSGTVTFEEADHEAAASANGNPVSGLQVQAERGMPAVWVYYLQQVDFTNALNQGLFARALRLDDAETLANNLSAEVQVSTQNDADGDGDSNVTALSFAETDPFCSADTNNAATYVVYLQDVDEDADGARMVGRRLEVDDPVANPITVSVDAESVIVSNADIDWDDSLDGTWPVIVLPSSDPAGSGIVFYVANGNNVADRGATGAFVEHRAFVFAPAILNTQAGVTHALPATQFDTDAVPNAVAFPQFQQLTEVVKEIHAVTVPRQPAARDFTFDNDEVTPTGAYFVWPEYVGSTYYENGEVWVARSLDLTASSYADVEDRFAPPLTSLPYDVSDRREDLDDASDNAMFLLPEGESVMTIYNGDPNDDNNGWGRFYVNVISPTGISTPALLTSDHEGALYDDGDGFGVDDDEFLVVPGPTCDNAVGAWFLYLSHRDSDASAVNYMQARRFTSVNLPR